MKIPSGATSFCPTPTTLSTGFFRGASIRHTFRPQGTEDWLLIYTLAGSGLYRFPGGEYESRPHDLTLYRPGAFQDYQVSPRAGKWDLAYAHFLPRPDWLTWLAWPEKAPGFMVLSPDDPALRRRIVLRLRDMDRLCHTAQARAHVFGLNALEEVLLWCDSINPRHAAQVDSRIRKALDYLTANLAEPFSEEKLARTAGMSASRMRHLFHMQTGSSPRRFQEERRIARARELLVLSRQTIGEIAQELGFENPFYFTLRFKKQTGESPRAFRQKREKGPRRA